jgi:superfamily II DNA or RNA helicase
MTSSSARASRESQSRPSPAPETAAGTQDEIERLARTRFGVGYLYPIQRFVVSNVLDGHPQIVVLPTGAGKSLCFLLPSLLLPGPTLVLMPLLSLLADQARKLQALGVAFGVLKGGLPVEEKARLWAGLRDGRIRLLLATPEACLAPANLAALASCRINHVVVDEAHWCFSTMQASRGRSAPPWKPGSLLPGTERFSQPAPMEMLLRHYELSAAIHWPAVS